MCLTGKKAVSLTALSLFQQLVTEVSVSSAYKDFVGRHAQHVAEQVRLYYQLASEAQQQGLVTALLPSFPQ